MQYQSASLTTDIFPREFRSSQETICFFKHDMPKSFFSIHHWEKSSLRQIWQYIFYRRSDTFSGLGLILSLIAPLDVLASTMDDIQSVDVVTGVIIQSF